MLWIKSKRYPNGRCLIAVYGLMKEVKMMKVFRNRSIALLLAFLMVFSFSLFSAFAVEADNGNENDVKAIKVDNYHDDIKNPYHPKSLIDWLEKTYNVDILSLIHI